MELFAMGVDEHRAKAPSTVRCFILTVSDTRDESTDESGKAARELLKAADHQVVGYRVVRDDPESVAALVRELATTDKTDVLLINGGTGLSRRDSTYEAVSGLFEKRMDGFGELFRMLSFKEIGPAAMLSRALAGVVGRIAVFSTPGSPAAVRLALTALIIPELGHVIGELRR